MFFKKIVYANSGSGLLFIMCGHCSPLVVWYNYHETYPADSYINIVCVSEISLK